jgi:hypothetical protein
MALEIDVVDGSHESWVNAVDFRSWEEERAEQGTL